MSGGAYEAVYSGQLTTGDDLDSDLGLYVKGNVAAVYSGHLTTGDDLDSVH